MEGLPGAGKTTLAIALTRHAGVRRHFNEGILFASLGPRADAMMTLSYWAKGLGTDTTGLSSATTLSQAVRDSIDQRRILLVIDDVWNLDAARTLRCGGPNCSHLVTTRDRAIARAFTSTGWTCTLPALDDEEAYQLLQALAPEACAAEPGRVRSLLHAVGGLPIAVSLIGGYLAAPEHTMYAELFPDLSEKALEEMSDPKRRLQLVDNRLGVSRGEPVTLEGTVAVSLEDLPDPTQQVFFGLGAFAPKPERFSPEAAVAVTKGTNAELAVLAARNLVQVSQADRQLTIHPILADVARKRSNETATTRHREYYLTFAMKHGLREEYSPFYDQTLAHDWSPIADAYGQIAQAWRNTPDAETLLDWLETLQPYLRARELWPEYLKLADQVLDMVLSQGMRREEGILRSNMGLAHYCLLEWSEAANLFQAALPILEEFDRAGHGRTLHNLGMVYHAQGQDSTALDYMKGAVGVLQEVEDVSGVAATFTDMAIILKASGYARQADTCFETAYALLEKVRNNPTAESALTNVLMTPLFRGNRDLQKPFLLFLVNKGVELQGAEVDFEGHIVLGVIRDEDDTADYWHAVFADGKRVEAGYIDRLPGDSDVVIMLDQQEAKSFVEGTYKLRPESVTGDVELLGKFIGRYLTDVPYLNSAYYHYYQ